MQQDIVSFRSPNKGSNCDRRNTLAYKENRYALRTCGSAVTLHSALFHNCQLSSVLIHSFKEEDKEILGKCR